ncbi:MAG: cell division protein FtsL [Pseudomonadota bacterium]
MKAQENRTIQYSERQSRSGAMQTSKMNRTRLQSTLSGLAQPGQLLLLIMVILSALAVVFSSYQSRQLFHELQTLQREVGSLHLEWRQLLVEEGAFSTHIRVENTATAELGMQAPGSDNTIAVREH